MTGDGLGRWRVIGFAATLLIAAAPLAWLMRQRIANSQDQEASTGEAIFVGRASCRPCHQLEYERWQDSDHDRAMALADAGSVRGDFDDAVFSSGGATTRFFRRNGRYMVNTRGADGRAADFEIAYTFGWEPLQQYLIEFPGGRLQCLTIAWDSDRGQWFDLQPGQAMSHTNWLHWTRAAYNWNGMCSQCHSTNVKKGFDPQTKTYHTTWSEIDVSCEACHGPGSRHVQWARIQPMARPALDNFGLVVNTAQLSSTEQVELCAPCHSRRSELGDYPHGQVALLDHHLPSLLDEGLYHADGQILDEVYVWGSFTQSKMYTNQVRCSDCHDSHSLKHPVAGNELCLRCHRADAYDSKDHHFHKRIHNGQPSPAVLCVKCHMPEQPYMVIDERADHSLRIPRPDLSRVIGTPNACSQPGCHDRETLQWTLDAYAKWYGQANKRHPGTALAAGRQARPEAKGELAAIAGDRLYPAIVRATALGLLAGYPRAHRTAAFSQALVDDQSLVRHTAVRHFRAKDQRQLVQLLAPLLFDPLKAVRMEAAQRLADAPVELLQPYQRDALAAALDEYIRAMQHALDFSYAGLNLGNLYARLRQPDKAEAYYQTAIATDDLFYPAKVNLAALLTDSGRKQEAEAFLRQVVKAYPEQYQAVYSYGLLLAELGRYKEAEVYLARAASGMPNHSGARRNLREVRKRLSRREAARPSSRVEE